MSNYRLFGVDNALAAIVRRYFDPSADIALLWWAGKSQLD